jgi:two-component system response regulator AtoC
MSRRLLIIEDDSSLAQMLGLHFADEGFRVELAATCTRGLELLRAEDFDLVLLDQQLPDGTGSELLPRLLEARPGLGVIMMTGRHDLELAIDAIQRGAAEFVHKPIDTDALQLTVNGLIDKRRLARERMRTPAEGAGDDAPLQRALIGRSSAMLAVSKAVALGARGSATVLICGESGTGKEVVARLIHQHSGVSGAFVAVNCAAIVDTLLESELFGYERGAFTGAHGRKLGKLEQAQDGTLFLDEVGELAPALQAKLLRVLQEQVFERVGGTETLVSTARVIAATNRDLMAEAAARRFREDLAFRLRVIEIRLPPLRERKDDIPLLVQGLLPRVNARLARPESAAPPAITEAALARLCAYDWPGNVRELENLLTRALMQARDGVITLDLVDLGAEATSAIGQAAAGLAPTDGHGLCTLEQVEAEHIQRVLDHTGGHKAQSCRILRISRPALDRKILKHGLRLPPASAADRSGGAGGD